MLRSEVSVLARQVSHVPFLGVNSALGHAQPLNRSADVLLAIDQHRDGAVEGIVATRGAALAGSSARITIDEMRVPISSFALRMAAGASRRELATRSRADATAVDCAVGRSSVSTRLIDCG